jgi:signal transduction histidine kinase
MTSSALLWGSASVFLFPESLVYALIVVFIAGGMAAGALGSVSYRFEAYVIYSLGVLVPFIVVLFLHSLPEFTIMGIILILFGAMLILASRKFYNNFHNAITLGFEQKLLLSDLAQALEDTRQASLVKEAFFATMSHELRTPLNSIIGFSQILTRKKEIPDELKTYISKILLSGNHLLELVNSILDFSKLKAGKMEPHKSTFLLHECFSEIEMIIEPIAQNRSISILYPHFDKEKITVDRKMIQQVFLNLLSNAIKFSPDNERIKITYQFLNNEHIFTICDHGHGIEPDHLETIFTPFSQLEEHKTGTPKGTGVGLAIVREMVQMHEGKAWVESVIAKGSCFYISLPATNSST